MMGRRWRTVGGGLAVLTLVALAIAGTWALSANRAPTAETTSVLLEVERGTTVRTLGRQLADRSLIRSPPAEFKPAPTICLAINRSTRSSTC